jgi:PAS domain S-box-containing protein
MSNPPGKIRLDAEQLKWPDFFAPPGKNVAPGNSYFRQVLGALPAAIYITDAAGVIIYYNEAAAALWGHRPQLGQSQWCGSWKLYWPDGSPLPHDQCPMAMALREGRPNRGLEAVAERPDGIRVPFMPYATPLYDGSGALIGAVNMLVDLTDRKRAGEHAQRLASIVEFSDDAIISKDLDGVITSWNRGAQRLFGYTAEDVIGKPVTILIPPDRQDEEPAILDRMRHGELVDHYETIRRRRDGSLVDISLTVSPIKNAEGMIIGASKIARDISDRKRAHEQQVLFVREIKHRIKNTMAIVQAIARQTLRAISDSDREAFFARLRALAGAHDLLTAENWSQASLRDVVDRALEPFKEGIHERLSVDGPDGIRLDAQKSCLVSMALHELATNAVKYGALSTASGRVHLGWEVLPDDPPQRRFRLRWQERGGPPVEPPEHRGFGSLLIQQALDDAQHKASLEFDPQGVTCTLEMSY